MKTACRLAFGKIGYLIRVGGYVIGRDRLSYRRIFDFIVRSGIIMSVLSVNKGNFDSVKTSDKTVLLDFYADWCGPCRMVSPLVDEIAEENPQYLVGKINVDSEPELAQTFGVASIPTLVVMKKGKIIDQVSGARPKPQILAMLES